MPTTCLLCELHSEGKRIVYENKIFWSLLDKNPVSEGHSLIIPKRHLISFFELNENDLSYLFYAMQNTKKTIEERFHPDAYNIGINDGQSAGRTIHHLHVHLIPRYKGDVENPIGGVRNIIPGKGYWRAEK